MEEFQKAPLFRQIIHSPLACGLGLLLASNSAFALDLTTGVSATNLFTGNTLTDFDEANSGTIFSELSLGPPASPQRPTKAKSIVTDEGIVRGSLQTGLTPFNTDAESTWIGRFRKNSADATFQFTITSAFLEIANETTANASAGFWFRIFNEAGDVQFEHRASISGHGGTSSSETYNKDVDDGPLIGTYKEYNPFEDPSNPVDRISVAELKFDPFTGSVDLSGEPVGGIFSIVYLLNLSANGLGGETWTTALFSDPANFESGGITTTITGLTPLPAVVPVPAAAWLFCSGLLGLIGMARCKKK